MARGSQEDRVTGLAAEVAFFSLLSLFPGLLTIAAGLAFIAPASSGAAALTGRRT